MNNQQPTTRYQLLINRQRRGQHTITTVLCDNCGHPFAFSQHPDEELPPAAGHLDCKQKPLPIHTLAQATAHAWTTRNTEQLTQLAAIKTIHNITA